MTCAACKHPKHIGRNCGAEISTTANYEGETIPIRCACDAAHAAKADGGKAAGYWMVVWRAVREVDPTIPRWFAELGDYFVSLDRSSLLTAASLLIAEGWGGDVLAAETEVADVYVFGAIKYAPNSWRQVPDAIRRYADAAYRHGIAALRGEVRDPESGKRHIAQALWNLQAVIDLTRGAEVIVTATESNANDCRKCQHGIATEQGTMQCLVEDLEILAPVGECGDYLMRPLESAASPPKTIQSTYCGHCQHGVDRGKFVCTLTGFDISEPWAPCDDYLALKE